MRPRLKTFFRSTRATSATEFALIVPIMLLFIAGITEIGRLYQVYHSVNQLASRYAITWADCSDYPAGTCNTALSTYASTYSMQNLFPQLTNTISLRMFEISMSGTVATVIYATPSNATLTSAELTTAQNAIASGQTGVVVTASYTHTLIFFPKVMSTFFGTNIPIQFTVAQDKS